MRLRSVFTVILTFGIALGSTSAIPVNAAPAQSGASQVLSDGTSQNYLVVYSGLSIPSGAASAIKRAGGTVLFSYSAIGVILASSSSSTFRSDMMQNSGLLGVDATGGFATSLGDNVQANDNSPDPAVNTPAPGNDDLSGLQWDMIQIHAPDARAINGGSRSVLVGDIDTGLDYTHPDLAPNVDNAASVNCVSGVPVPGMGGKRR